MEATTDSWPLLAGGLWSCFSTTASIPEQSSRLPRSTSPFLWRHVCWRPEPPNGQGKDSRYGWLYYRRVKTKKQFYRPMNRVVKVHLKSLCARWIVEPDQASVRLRHVRARMHSSSGSARLAGVKPKQDVETGEEKLWVLKDLGRPVRPTTTSTCPSHPSRSSVIPWVA